MPVIPADPRPASWPGGGFRGEGSFAFVGRSVLDERWREIAWVARLFVRLGGHDLSEVVELVRSARGDPADLVLAAQAGAYAHAEAGPPVPEKGAQVILFDLVRSHRSRRKAFTAEAVAVAEAVGRALGLDFVVVQIQRKGLQQGMIGVTLE